MDTDFKQDVKFYITRITEENNQLRAEMQLLRQKLDRMIGMGFIAVVIAMILEIVILK